MMRKKAKKCASTEQIDEEKVMSNDELLSQLERAKELNLDVLEEILMEKMQGLKISKKLRKLAQRESMLPERGDMQLLAEMNTLSKMVEKPVGIVSSDKDFTMFSKEIFEEFGVKVV